MAGLSSQAPQRSVGFPHKRSTWLTDTHSKRECSSLLIAFLLLGLAVCPRALFAAERKIVIRSIPPGAKVALTDDSQMCKALRHGAADGVAPCMFAFDKAFFDPSGGMFEDSKILGVPLQISVSKEGYQTRTVTLTDGPHVWKGKDKWVIERTYYFIKAQGFDVRLDKETAYQQLASQEVRKGSTTEALADGKRLYYGGNFSGAVQALDAAAALSTKPNSEVYEFRCLAQFQLQRYALALKDCQEFARLVPRDNSAWTNTGRILQAMGQDESAIENFSKAIELDPKNLTALRDRAASYRRLNRLQGALADYQKILSITPRDAETLIERADLYIAAGKCPQGEQGATAAMGNDVEHAKGRVLIDQSEALLVRGEARLCLGQYDSATTDFTEVITLDPRSPLPYIDRARARRLAGAFESAKEDLATAASLLRSDPNAPAWMKMELESELKALGDVKQSNLSPK